jgi:outer membrane protein OmpU
MKKILLATTLLAASTGYAAAEVAISGSARMGVTYDGDDFFYTSRVRIVFDATGETDGGLAFGASVRADQTGGNGANTIDLINVGPDGVAGTPDDFPETVTVSGNTGTTNGDSTVWISGAFGKLTMGDVSGAADALVGQTSGVGFGPNDGLHEIGFLGAEKTAVYYEHTIGMLTFGLGAGQVGSDDFSVGAKYATDAFSIALGFEDDGVDTLTSVKGEATFGAITLKAKAADGSALADTEFSVSADYAMNALTLTAVYTDFDGDDTAAGLGASFDLGGGASLVGGVVMTDTAGVSDTVGDFGVKMSF